MAGRPLEYEGFPLGLDNLHREDSLKLGSLRAAVNVDLDANGKPARRRGRQRVITGGVHSATAAFDSLIAVVDGVLTAYDASYSAIATIASGLSGRPLQYAHTPHRTLWSDGTQLRAFDRTLVDTVAWPSEPGWPGGATVVPMGGLHAGSYQIAITQIDAFGRESGAGRALLVEGVERNGGVLLADLPNPPEAVTLRVYATDANDVVLRHVGDVAPGAVQYLVAWGPRGTTLEPHVQWLTPLPAGQALCYCAGRVFVASGRTLYFSEPMRHGAMLPDNRITFGEDITLLAPVGSGPDAGLYVAAGKRTLYLPAANPKEAPLTAARATGAVPGTVRSVHTSAFSSAFEDLAPAMAAVWVSSDGVFCLGLPGGSILPLTEKRVVLPRAAESGAVMLRNEGGLSQVVATVSGGDTSRAGAADKLTGTIYRNGIAVVE